MWRLANGPTGSYAGTKRQLNAWLYGRIEEQLELEAQIQQERSRSADVAEGIAAFAAKRPPVFTGRLSPPSGLSARYRLRPGQLAHHLDPGPDLVRRRLRQRRPAAAAPELRVDGAVRLPGAVMPGGDQAVQLLAQRS